MSKALANPKLFALTGVLFVAASGFNLYSGAMPSPKVAPVVKSSPVRGNINTVPMPLPNCDAHPSDPRCAV